MINNYTYVQGNNSLDLNIDNDIWIKDITGLSENNITVSTSQGVNQIGSTLGSMSVQEKTITINGTIKGETREKRSEMIHVIAPAKLAKLILNDTYEIDVTPEQTPLIENNLRDAGFQIILKAPFPYWKTVDQENIDLLGKRHSFKFPWNLTKSWRFGKVTESYFENIFNEGIETSFRIMLTTNTIVVNPEILNVTSGLKMKLNRTINAGETVIINTSFSNVSAILIVGNNSYDIFNDIDIDSDLFQLERGDNIFRVYADEYREALNCHILYQKTWAGR
jgi:hypothetical protein